MVNVKPTDPAALARFGALYRQFVSHGDLAIDIGASIGENTTLLVDAGACVLAVEPLEECAALIEESPAVRVLESAVGARCGSLELMVCGRALDVSTASSRWASSLTDAGLASGPWDERRTVPMTTLDDLIAEFGTPAFVKIDVEGYESEVLAGLSEPVPALSLETHACLGEEAVRRLRQLRALGFARFAVSEGHSAVLSEWMDAASAEVALRQLTWGDLYARL